MTLRIYLAGLSAIVALVHALIRVTPLKRFFFRRSRSRPPVIHEVPEAGLLSEVKVNIKSNGGIVIWSFKVARLLGSIALFAVATTAAIIASDDTFRANGKHWGKKHRHRHGGQKHRFSDYEWLQIALAAFYMYTSFLALCTLILVKRVRRPAKNHLNVLFSSALLVYLYRDVWPLATFTLHPVDPHHWTTWTSIALLILVAVVIPVSMPHEYIPVNRSNPYKDVNPEQTASWFSFFCFTFLDPIVFEASRTDHLPYEALPPLADYDAGDHLRNTSFPHSLRIRMKEEVPASEKPGGGTTVVPTPESEAAEPLLPHASQADGNGTAGTSQSGVTPQEATARGKGKPQKETSVARSVTSSTAGTSTKKSENLVGKINNFVSTDLGNITEARDFLFMVWYTPLQIAICVWFLYSILGVASILGMGVLISTRKEWSARTPEYKLLLNASGYLPLTTSSNPIADINVLRMIKLFAWEGRVKQKMVERREDELLWTKKRQFLQLLNMNTNFSRVFKYCGIRYAKAGNIFVEQGDQLHIVLWGVNAVIQGKVSLDRLTDFLNNTELLDSFQDAKKDTPIQIEAPSDPNSIGFRNATFTWANSDPGTPTPGRRNFRLKIDGEVYFTRGGINMIVGPTGAGKSSILMALLGEMHFQPAGPDAFYNLPRSGGVSFCSQEPWITNQTIRENILFGSPYEEERYKKVLYQCALETDLEMFNAGDQTEVGEKGLTLSGGQKARVSLARAIYSHSQIILLDDVLSALDVHTSSWIVEKCFKGDLVQNRTILLVTHNVAMVSPVAKYVLGVGLDGRISSKGTLEQALANDAKLREELQKEKETIKKGAEVVDAPVKETKDEKPAQGKLIVAEEVALGRVSWSALKMYLTSLGGLAFWVCFISGFLLADLLSVVQTFWLGFWASQYEHHSSKEVNVLYYLMVYGILLLVGMIVYSSAFTVYLFGSLSASRKIHDRLVSTILGTTFRWLDTTPVGRIISRFTLDIRAVDGPISGMLADFAELTITMLVKLAAVIYMTPAFAIPGFIVGGLGSWLGNIYIKAQLSVKREMTNARSPVFSHFNAAIAGLPSIRAYDAQEMFRQLSLEKINKYTRWISFRIDFLGAAFSAALASYLIYVRPESASNVGFSLTMAIAFSGMILWWVRIGNEFEVSCNSLERIENTLKCDQEPPATDANKPPAYWPSSGHLVVEKLAASYSTDGPEVLHDISFEIKSGERVGVVGRTGSGKSSLTLSLLRLIPTTGAVMYDGIATAHINLNALRNHITIIPQQPELLSGSVRDNLDPFGEYDDAVLNDALRASGLNHVQAEEAEEMITLDSSVSSGGSNFSLGQRQILSLARAICRQSKVLILDEATAAIDHQTDALIQTSIRTELKDVTVITVAHRLKTIGDSDKIIVLDGGRLVEFDSPANLLRKENGHYKSLVDQSGEKKEIYKMAGIDLEKHWFSRG
ncbi:hypothetical protein FRC17_005452 [Serendipita sp. 399]|nr:hypothetical protein FRC17_005452 [Serendipita sp. 399]